MEDERTINARWVRGELSQAMQAWRKLSIQIIANCVFHSPRLKIRAQLNFYPFPAWKFLYNGHRLQHR